MSALSPKADIRRDDCDVRFVPKADIRSAGFHPSDGGAPPADCRTARRTHRSVRAEPFVRETGNRSQRRSGGIEVRAQSNRRRAWLVPFTQKRHGIIVRAHEAGHPAVAKAPGIKERPQIRFAIVRLKPFGSRETSGTVCPVCKRRTAQVMPNFLQGRSRRSHALALS